MHETLKLRIARPGEFTWAEVSLRKTEQIYDGKTAHEAITNAVTDWVLRTENGRRAWLESMKDFNVGDLMLALPDGELSHYLELHGVFDLTVDITHCPDVDEDWVFDALLVDREAVTPNGS